MLCCSGCNSTNLLRGGKTFLVILSGSVTLLSINASITFPSNCLPRREFFKLLTADCFILLPAPLAPILIPVPIPFPVPTSILLPNPSFAGVPIAVFPALINPLFATFPVPFNVAPATAFVPDANPPVTIPICFRVLLFFLALIGWNFLFLVNPPTVLFQLHFSNYIRSLIKN